jgi:PAS domain S-box-containing protein
MQVVEIPWSQTNIHDLASESSKGASSKAKSIAYLGSLRDVTDQNLALDRLLWMQQAIESASDAIAITNRTGQVIHQNPAFCQLFEYQDCQEINQLNPTPKIEVFTSSNYPKFLSNLLRHSPLISALFIDKKLAEEVLKVVRNGQSWQGEVMMRSQTGKVMQIALKADAIENYPGHIIGLICTYTDVTERRQAEEMLRRSLAQNQAILKTIPDTLFRIKADGTYLDCHQGISRQLYNNYREYIGQKCQDVLPPFLAQELMAAIEQALVTKKVQVFEYQLVLPGENGGLYDRGRLYDYEARVSAIDDHEVLTMVRDVSAKAEAQRSLKESEQRYRTLTETSQDMIFIFNRDTSINYVNTYAAHELNSSPEQLIGQSVQDIFPRTFATEIASKIYQVLRDKQLCTLEQQLNFAHQPVWWHFSLVPLRNETGILTTVLAVARNITERIKAEAALQQSQEKLRQSEQQLIRTLATAPIGITTCDLNGEFKSVNPALCQMLGYFASDLRQMSLADLVHPSDRPRLKSWIATFPASVLSQSQKEYALIRQDGSEMIATIRVALVRDAAEKALQLVATIEDITERKRSQEQLLLLSKAVESASDAIAITDSYGRSTYHNPAFIELFGFSASDLAAVGGPQVLYRDASVAAEVFDTIFREGSWQGEVEMLSTQGVTRQIFLRVDAIQDATGEIIARVGVYRDITDRKQAIDALAESEERFRTLADTAPVLIWLADPHGNYTFFNQTWLEFTGRKIEQEQGQGWMSQIHPDDFQHCLREYLNAIEQSEPFRLLYRLRRKDGEYRWLLNTGVPCKTPGGNLAGYIGSCIDISDRKKLEEELAERAKQLEQSNAELEQFAYVASHDLQEPLRTIASYTQLLARRYEGQLDEKADKYIHYVVDGAQRMQTLIDDLLKYSRVSTSRQELQPVDCQEILEQAIGHLKVAIRQAGAEVSLDPTCPRLPVVLGDATQLLQLFQNLISNGIKYRQPEVKPVVQIAAKPSQFKNSVGCWLFAVKDNGIGIDPQHRDRIFLIFQRLHTRNEYPGTGIGLAVCHKIVERHQGQIWVESQLGQGATFYFTLPQV